MSAPCWLTRCPCSRSQVRLNKNISQHLLRPPAASRVPRSLFYLYAPLKVLQQLLQLLWVLCVSIPAPDAILVQNPPSIPVLAVSPPRARLGTLARQPRTRPAYLFLRQAAL